MVDMFDVLGIIQFGIAGNANSSLSIGDINRLGQIGFITEELFSQSGRANVVQNVFWVETSRHWLHLATKLESVAVVMASICFMILSNGLPVIVFRGLSELAGGQEGQNATKAVIQFIDMLPVHVSKF
ncbi:hypothetical protein MKW94_028094 [Papaver nudicaule]|uniref:Uncharacterized protein n=1 Tax=Papaver nudicaule TaxID=74823 RepID=A0AA41VTA3_PAPNU|nr:hypothetical protein [Papaver nudicaule]